MTQPDQDHMMTDGWEGLRRSIVNSRHIILTSESNLDLINSRILTVMDYFEDIFLLLTPVGCCFLPHRASITSVRIMIDRYSDCECQNYLQKI